MPTAGSGRGHALYVCSGGGVNRHASVVPSALLLRIGWRRDGNGSDVIRRGRLLAP